MPETLRGAEWAGDVPLPLFRHPEVIYRPWPFRDNIELGSLPGAAPCARLHARHVLREWGLSRFSETVELLVSELVTNAVIASQAVELTPPVRLWLMADQSWVLVLVQDASSQPPVSAEAKADDESGRGLLLVEAVSERWDWYLTSETDGKVVWALVDSAKLHG